MHLEDFHFTTQYCIAISDTHSRNLRAKKNLLNRQKRRERANSASVIWHVVSFGQKYTNRLIGRPTDAFGPTSLFTRPGT